VRTLRKNKKKNAIQIIVKKQSLKKEAFMLQKEVFLEMNMIHEFVTYDAMQVCFY